MKKNIILLAAVLLLCGCGETTTSSLNESSSSEQTTTSQIVVDNNGFKLRMFGDLYINTTRTIYAELENYEGQEIYWSSSDPEIISVSPRSNLTTECTLRCKKTGKVTIVAQDSKNLERRVAKQFIIEEGEAMPVELFNKITGGVKLTSIDKCLSYDSKYNPTVDEEYHIETIYEEENPSEDIDNKNDAYQITINDVKTNQTSVSKFVKGVGGYVCSEYLDYNNEINTLKVLNEDDEGIKWEYSYYCNLWRNTDLVTNEDFRTFDGGKTYHFASIQFDTPIHLGASMYLLNASADDLYFVVGDNNEMELHFDIDPYNRDVNLTKTGRKIVTKISEVDTARIDHIKPYEHLSLHDKIDSSITKMAQLKNYNVSVNLDYSTGDDYRYDFTFTNDTIDQKVYRNQTLYYHDGSHKDNDGYYTYQYNDAKGELTINKKYSQSWDSVNRYPTFDFASEIFTEVSNNKYETIGNESMFIEMCTYLSSSFSLYTYDSKGYLELDENGFVKKINTSLNALGDRLNVTIEYSNYNSAVCDVDFSNVNENNLPTSFKDGEPRLYASMSEYGYQDVLPYLYSSVGYNSSAFKFNAGEFHFVKTNEFATSQEKDEFIANYKLLLLSEGYVETNTVEENTGFALYQKGDYKIGVGADKYYNGNEKNVGKIIIMSPLFDGHF